MNRFFSLLFSFLALLLLTSCESNMSIVTNIDEKEANEIIVYLASKGIAAQKVQGATSELTSANAPTLYNIMVSSERSVDAMSILNKVGLPRRMGTNLLELFAKSGLMSSDREETIRYQAGLAEELQNTIRKIDGVIDADVQISFPSSETAGLPGAIQPKVTAAVYVKHQGVLDDPNNHMEIKIKRLMSASVSNLDYDNVTVISDRSRFTDVNLSLSGEPVGNSMLDQTYVSIWGLVLTKSSLLRFRILFFSFLILISLLLGAIGWGLYTFYPLWRKRKEEEAENNTKTTP